MPLTLRIDESAPFLEESNVAQQFLDDQKTAIASDASTIC